MTPLQQAAQAVLNQWQLGVWRKQPTPQAFVYFDLQKTLAAELASAAISAPSVPEGWKLVPIEPTPEMLEAAHEGDREYTLRNFGDIMTVQQGPYDHWVAMLNAAPQPQEPTCPKN